MRPPQEQLVKLHSPPQSNLIVPIERGMAILDAFNADDSWLGNQEIAERTGIPKSTVSRLTQTLTVGGCLRHSPALRKYRLAPAVLALGYAAIADSDVVTIARPLMQKFANDNGVFVALARRDALDMVLLEICHSSTSLMTLGLRIGAHTQIVSTSVGLALLSGLPKVEQSYLIDHVLRRYDKNHRVMLRKRIDDAVRQIEERGYCTHIGIWHPDVAVAAAPVYIANKPPMAIGCAGPKKQITKARLDDQIGPQLAELVAVLQAQPWQNKE